MNQLIKIYVKLVIFSIINGQLHIFLKENRLPVVSVDPTFGLDDLAANLLTTTFSGVRKSYLEQLYTFSKRQNNATEIAITYYCLLPSYAIDKDQKNFVVYRNTLNLFSDGDIVEYARKRLQWKVEYTNIIYSLLPPKFTLSKLQQVYEAVLGKALDKRNFRKKILGLGILKNTGQRQKIGRARPAQQYCFRKRQLTYVQIL